MAAMNVLENLNSRAGWRGKAIKSLLPSIKIMEALGNPQNTVPAIIVAGTNGKGSVCSMLAAILASRNQRVAQFTSPHLQHYTERLLIQGRPVAESRLLNAVEQVIAKEQEAEVSLSFFELIVAASFLVCSEEKLDWMVVEVGLGGRLDATNVIDKPKATVITSIGLDHTEILGPTEYLIAKEKAGIFRENVPAFVGVVSEDVKRSISECAVQAKCPVNFLTQVITTNPTFPQYKANNITLARRVASSLGFSNSEIESGITKAKWPGRLEEASVQTEYGEQKLVIDGAHNPDGVRGLIDYLDRRVESEFVFLISILSTKDSSSMLSLLKDWAKDKKVKFIFCKIKNESAISPLDLSAKIEGSVCTDSSDAGVTELKSSLRNGQLGVITGSLYFIGEVRGEFVKEPFATIK